MKSIIAILVTLMALTIFVISNSSASGASDDKKAPIKLFEKYGCTECHTISALGIGESKAVENEEEKDAEEGEAIDPPDLSDVGGRHDAKWISGFLRKKITIDGRKHKKRFKGKKEERKILSIWLESLKYADKDSTGGKKSESPNQRNNRERS